VEQQLFHDEHGLEDLEAEFRPPPSPVQIGLDELIQISKKKRRPPRLSQRRIQVLGRQIERFVPIVWRPRRISLSVSRILWGDQAGCPRIQREDPENFARDGACLKVATHCNPNGGRKKEHMVLGLETEGVDGDFFGQLWECPEKPKFPSTAATNPGPGLDPVRFS
jgi:hypothetical protein